MRNDEVRIEQGGWELAGGQTLRSRTIRSFGLHPARPAPPSSSQLAIITRPKREAEYAQVDLQLPHAVLALLLALAQPVGPDVGRRIVLLERLERALEREVDKRVARLVPETERVTVRGGQASATELQEGGGGSCCWRHAGVTHSTGSSSSASSSSIERSSSASFSSCKATCWPVTASQSRPTTSPSGARYAREVRDGPARASARPRCRPSGY